jgi:RNA recognition motif-containing protein
MLGKNSSVVLFIKGLPESTTKSDIRSLFQRLKNRHWGLPLTGKSALCSCDILRITNPISKSVEYHAMVEIHPAKLALRAIRELNGALIRGHPVELHRYHHRSPIRDRRREENELNAPPPQDADAGDNRRALDRRRENLQVELVSITGSPMLPVLGRMLGDQHIAKNFGV